MNFQNSSARYATLVATMEQQTVGQLVKRLREDRGLTQGQLATYSGVTRSWLSRVEIDQIVRPERERLEAIAQVLQVSSSVLLAAAGYRVTPLPLREDRTPAEIVRELDAAIRRKQEQSEQEQLPIMVPETTGRASMGVGTNVEPEYWPYWPGPGERSHKFIAVPVVGDCMEPNIREGERVIVDTDASPRPGDTVVAEHEGEHIVKMLEERVDGLWLVARKRRPALRVGDRTRIVGVVRMVSHRP